MPRLASLLPDGSPWRRVTCNQRLVGERVRTSRGAGGGREISASKKSRYKIRGIDFFFVVVKLHLFV